MEGRRAARLAAVEPHRLGYSFFWSCALYAALGTGGGGAGLMNLAWTQQLSLVASLIALAVLCRLRRPSGRTAALLAGFAMSASGLALAATSLAEPGWHVPEAAAGAVFGLSNAVQFLLWQTVYANEGQYVSSICLPLSAALGSAASLGLLYAPPLVSALYIAAAAPFASTACLLRCLDDMEPYRARPIRRDSARLMLKDLWQPVLCSAITCVAWASTKRMAESGLGGAVLLAAGFCAASALVLSLSLFTRCDFGAPNVYRVVFPLLCAALLAPALFGQHGATVLSSSLGFGAHIMTLLVSMTAAAYAARTQFSPTSVFLMVMLPSQVAILLGDALGTGLSGQEGLSAAQVMGPTSALLIALLAVMIATSLRQGGRTLAEPADDTLLINPRAASAVQGRTPAPEPSRSAREPLVGQDAPAKEAASALCGLTAREQEVVSLLLKGNTMSAISRKLYISDNTTRGHMRRIYQKLDVHSRQELVDKLEGDAGRR